MGWNSQGMLNFYKDQDLKKEKEEERALERENALFALTLESMKAQNKYRTGEKYTAAIDANRVLRNDLISSDLTPEDLEFYKPILEDPFASKFVIDFMKERAKDGVEISYSMIPSMLNVVSSNAPEVEKIDYIERITGADLTGKEGKKLYKKLATEIISAPTQIQSTLLISPKPGMSTDVQARDKYQKAQREKLIAQIDAMLDFTIKRDLKTKSAEDPNLRTLIVLQEDLKAGGDKANRAFQTLLPMFMTREQLEKLQDDYPKDFIGVFENPYIPNIFPVDLEENK